MIDRDRGRKRETKENITFIYASQISTSDSAVLNASSYSGGVSYTHTHTHTHTRTVHTPAAPSSISILISQFRPEVLYALKNSANKKRDEGKNSKMR